MENKEFYIQLTRQLYQLTLLFPKKEPLRYKMRQIADDILADLIKTIFNSLNKKPTETGSLLVLENLEVLDSFFEIAKNQNWVNPSQLLEVQEKYFKIKEDFNFSNFSTNEEQTEINAQVSVLEKLPEIALVKKLMENRISGAPFRQQKILEILKNKEKTQVWELKNIFPEVTKRTLRRDFEQLLKRGLVERLGERNETFYKIKSINTIYL